MKLNETLGDLRKAEVFDLSLLEVLSGQSRNVLKVQLHRWVADGSGLVS